MVGLIVSLVAGVLAAVVAMLAGVSPGGSLWIAVTASLIVLLVLIVMTVREIERQQQWLTVRFPAAPLSTEPEQPTV
jgi:Flp pilus assembly protein TadB